MQDNGTQIKMTKICNFPTSKSKRCKQPIADDKPNCGRHRINLSAEQLGQNPTVYQKDGELHIWVGKPDSLYCLIHGDPACRVLYQLSGEKMPPCVRQTVEWKDADGMPHKDDGPAVLRVDGTQKWYRHGFRHREDGPAVVEPDGTQRWYQHGELHRDGGPAFVGADGTQKWYQYGRLHRGDGPAFVGADGEHKWYQYGKLHRDDGPAIVESDGTQAWYRHSDLHRDDGPALIRADGTQEWWQYDECHREDGPAIIKANGRQEWRWHGWHVTEQEHTALRERSKNI